MNWEDRFKAALVMGDYEKAAGLLKEMPRFEDVARAKEARDLIGEAMERMKNEQVALKKGMNNLKKTRQFLTEEGRRNSFNLVL